MKPATIRIIAGELKGRRLSYPPRCEQLLRPTMARTRESVFSMLQDDVRGVVFVDLYAAAGGIGIEALSRGAARALFVERNPEALACLDANLRACGIDATRAAVHRTEVERFIRHGGLDDPAIRLVFADPPYHTRVESLLALLDEKAYPHVHHAIVEHRGAIPVRAWRHWEVARARRFGDTFVTFLSPRTTGKDA